jgi:hypothetical protein
MNKRTSVLKILDETLEHISCAEKPHNARPSHQLKEKSWTSTSLYGAVLR